MQNQPIVEFIAYGPRLNMVSEYGAHDMTQSGDPAYTEERCAFLTMPVGDADFTTEEHATLADAREAARYLADAYGVKASYVGG